MAKRGRPKAKATKPKSVRIGDDMDKWLTDWADRHVRHVNGEPNIAEAIRMQVELAMLVDLDEENIEIINKEFAGDWRAFARRAIQDYARQYHEANALDISEDY